MPRASLRTQKKFVLQRSGTIDAGRGCPVRLLVLHDHQRAGPQDALARSAGQILAQIRENYVLKGRRAGVRHYFFTDDNFARNPQWEAIFDGLIGMRDSEGVDIDFMMQVDVQAPRIPASSRRPRAPDACRSSSASRRCATTTCRRAASAQNKTADYREMIARGTRSASSATRATSSGFPTTRTSG